MVARIYADSVDFQSDGAEPWMDEAACRQDVQIDLPIREVTEPEDYFPYGKASARVINRCVEKCSVRLKCLAYALEMERPNDDKRYGIWGGLDPGERRKIQKQLDTLRAAQIIQETEE